MAQFPVSGQSACIFQPGYSQATTVRNIGANPVYLDSSINVNPASSYPLGPGATLQWDAGQALYVICDPGLTSTLVTVRNSGNLFDPVSIGTAILNGGLAAQIAAAISVNGAPPIDALTMTTTVVVQSSPSVYAFDVSKYQSITVTVREQIPSPVTTPVAREIELRWQDVGPFNPNNNTDAEAFASLDNNATTNGDIFTLYQTSVKNKMLYLKTGLVPFGNTVTVTIVGSYKTVVFPRYLCSSPFMQPGTFLYSGTCRDNIVTLLNNGNFPGGSGGIVAYPDTKGGPATFWFDAYAPGVGYQIQVAIFDLFSGVTLYNTVLRASVAGPLVPPNPVSLILPRRPIQLFFSTSGGALSWPQVRASLTFDR